MIDWDRINAALMQNEDFAACAECGKLFGTDEAFDAHFMKNGTCRARLGRSLGGLVQRGRGLNRAWFLVE